MRERIAAFARKAGNYVPDAAASAVIMLFALAVVGGARHWLGAVLAAVLYRVLPGLFKINTVKKPAQKARKGIDPFTKQERMFAAKPASVKVKVRPLKKLKDLAG